MSSFVMNPVVGLPPVFYQSLLEVDTDINATRVVIMDRYSAKIIANDLLVGGVFKAIIPLEYSTSNNLIVMIIDDDMTYNCEAIDGVTAEVIDGIITRIK